jgi:hypothetical protein
MVGMNLHVAVVPAPWAVGITVGKAVAVRVKFPIAWTRWIGTRITRVELKRNFEAILDSITVGVLFRMSQIIQLQGFATGEIISGHCFETVLKRILLCLRTIGSFLAGRACWINLAFEVIQLASSAIPVIIPVAAVEVNSYWNRVLRTIFPYTLPAACDQRKNNQNKTHHRIHLDPLVVDKTNFSKNDLNKILINNCPYTNCKTVYSRCLWYSENGICQLVLNKNVCPLLDFFL